MRYDVLTLFPGMFEAVLHDSLIGRAHEKGIIESHVHDIRSYSADRHRKVDDTPFGGGAGMVLSPQAVFDALKDIGTEGARLLYMSPRGRLIDRELIDELIEGERLILLCGHYEGVDQRILDSFPFEEVSAGDYVLTGGELPAMILIDALTRLLPGVLGSHMSHDEESIYSGLLEYPQYTRPAVYEGLEVPEVLMNGNHRDIRNYNFKESLLITKSRRPDLLERYILAHPGGAGLTKDQQRILAEVME